MQNQRRDLLKVAALAAGAAMLGTSELAASEKAFKLSKRDHSKQRALLLSSSGYKDTKYLSHAVSWIGKFAQENNLTGKKIVFIPYASLRRSYDEYEKRVKEALASLNLNIVGVHHAKNAAKEVASADCIFVGGGNTFKLVHDMYENELIALISKMVEDGTPYIGWSAGSNVAGATMMTTNDMPIIEPESFNTFNIFPHQINPHFISGKPVGHNGESREERLEEFLIANQKSTVYAMPEGTAFWLEGEKATVLGPAAVLKMNYNKKVELIEPGSSFKY